MDKSIFASVNTPEKEISKNAFGSTLCILGETNKDIVVCEADLMRASGTNEFLDKFPERHFNFGVAEQNCMSAAAGLALEGKTVFATTFANFASKRACDQNSISIAYNKANVKICGTYAGLTCEKNGGTHISVEDIAIMRSMPNMCVVEPADTAELADMTRVLCEYNGPVYLRIPKMFLRTVFNENYSFNLGKATEIMSGDDATIIACGITTGIAMDAAKELKKQGIAVSVINMSSIKPIDANAVIKAADCTGVLLTVENHSVIGGLGSAVAEVLADNGIGIKFKRLGIQDKFGLTADLKWLINHFGISKQHIISTVKELISI